MEMKILSPTHGVGLKLKKSNFFNLSKALKLIKHLTLLPLNLLLVQSHQAENSSTNNIKSTTQL